jgi:hypothetical protein
LLLAQSCHSGSSATKHENSAVAKAEADSIEVQAQTKCPVMGNDVDRSVFTIWAGDDKHSAKKVYFCCPMCIEKFKSNPAKCIAKLENMKQPLENAVIEQQSE